MRGGGSNDSVKRGGSGGGAGGWTRSTSFAVGRSSVVSQMSRLSTVSSVSEYYPEASAHRILLVRRLEITCRAPAGNGCLSQDFEEEDAVVPSGASGMFQRPSIISRRGSAAPRRPETPDPDHHSDISSESNAASGKQQLELPSLQQLAIARNSDAPKEEVRAWLLT